MKGQQTKEGGCDEDFNRSTALAFLGSLVGYYDQERER